MGGIVAATSGASVIYQVDRWKLFPQTVIHFAIMMYTVLFALFWNCWFTLDSPLDHLSVVGIFLSASLLL